MRQGDFDRAHAVRVAKRVERRLAATAYGNETVWLAAALMHDVGKVEAALSARERVLAMLASKAVGVDAARRWAASASGAKRRIGSYLIHGEVGAAMIRAAGGREEVALWARIHQGYRTRVEHRVPPVVVEALLESDVG